MSHWGLVVVLGALAGCGSAESRQSFVLPGTFTDATCARHARDRVQDASLMGYGVDIQARVASDVYGSCLKDRNS